jgi:hypothetical protein
MGVPFNLNVALERAVCFFNRQRDILDNLPFLWLLHARRYGVCAAPALFVN